MELKLMSGKPVLYPISRSFTGYEFIRKLRMDDRVKSGFVEDVNITIKDKQIYMEKYKDCYRICLLYGKHCGYVGVIDDDIRICTHPDFQGKGVGKFMLSEIVKIFPSAKGRIKKDNLASIKLFESCGVPYELI